MLPYGLRQLKNKWIKMSKYRTINYKAFDYSTKKMYQEALPTFDGAILVRVGAKKWDTIKSVSEEEPCLLIVGSGVMDSEGKEIFCGDVLKSSIPKNDMSQMKAPKLAEDLLFTVFFSNGSYRLIHTDADVKILRQLYAKIVKKNNLTIVGNKYTGIKENDVKRKRIVAN